jgi:hypothetical protein
MDHHQRLETALLLTRRVLVVTLLLLCGFAAGRWWPSGDPAPVVAPERQASSAQADVAAGAADARIGADPGRGASEPRPAGRVADVDSVPMRESPASCIPWDECCRVCSRRQACGDACLNRSLVCYQPRGCACDVAEVCS